MKLYSFTRIQNLPIPIEEAWSYFSNPRNLNEITPKKLNLTMTCTLPEKMYIGLLITYKVRPVFGIPLNWVTEITNIEEPSLFVDEQRFGPYRFWHHQHHFRKISGGVEMKDIVSYALPFDPFSRPINALIVRSKLNSIFDFRFRFLEQRYGPLKIGGSR
jgi:ligand-binding SRPBCC domain-containing protein